MSNGLYRLDAFGLNNVWNRWRLEHGALDEPEIEDVRKRHELFHDDFYDGEAAMKELNEAYEEAKRRLG